MYPVALRDEIRTWVLIQGQSQRAAARHFGLSRNTVAKLVEEEPAPEERHYQRQAEHKTPVRDAAKLLDQASHNPPACVLVDLDNSGLEIATLVQVLKSAGSLTQPVQVRDGSPPRASRAKIWMLSNGAWVTV